ncbi:MAG: hypothetical protein PVF47_05000 [Anaerolineae bacterium]|jgi:hypothetical protein
MLVGEKVTLRTIRQADLEVLYDLGADVRYMGDYWPLHIYSEIQTVRRDGWLAGRFGHIAHRRQEG